MNLQREISPELWKAVCISYEAGHYANAITDGFHYLTEVIRERAGVDGDGPGLVGQALGSSKGNAPKLLINKYQTESEKKEQEGFDTMLRGIYIGIRNPRSHGQWEDTLSNASAIILFLDYILRVINSTEQPFTIDKWIDQVFDQYFVLTEEYAEEYANDLIDEIPPGKRLDSLITLYQRRGAEKGDVLKLVFEALFDRLDDGQKRRFAKIVSDELKITQDENDIILHFHILPLESWDMFGKRVKSRLENMVIKSIQEGRYEEVITTNGRKRRCTAGILGTWSPRFYIYFVRKADIVWTLINKLDGDEEEKNYIGMYFLQAVPAIANESQQDFFLHCLCNSLVESSENSLFLEIVGTEFNNFSSTWRDISREKLS
jgi:uncharacterized protein (TIGR02391 family)